VAKVRSRPRTTLDHSRPFFSGTTMFYRIEYYRASAGPWCFGQEELAFAKALLCFEVSKPEPGFVGLRRSGKCKKMDA